MDATHIRSIEYVETVNLKSARRNARTHPKRQIEQIAQSMERHGFTNPVLIDDEGRIIAGHGRVEAAKLIGLSLIPCVRLSGMSDAEKRAYIIADNKLAQSAGWDLEILAIEFHGLMELGFDMSLTGFELPEIDMVLTEVSESLPEPVAPEDVHPKPLPDAITRIGDHWIMDRHGLVCGDAKDAAVLETLMGADRADMVFTDPPWNLQIQGHVSGLGKTRHREFVEGSGEMSKAGFTDFLCQSLKCIARVCRSGAIVYVCIDWRHLQEMLTAGTAAFSELKNLCVWAKTNGGMGTFYRSQHELIFVWKVGDAPHINNFGLGDKGRYRTNIWSYPGVNTFKAGRMEEIAQHPTSKPVALVADAIRDVSHRGNIVLDSFGGSGTTLIAAQKTGRCARLIELDPRYCDVIVKRWQKLTGKSATLADTGETFESVSIARNAGPSGFELDRAA